jgi:hypothetical protein
MYESFASFLSAEYHNHKSTNNKGIAYYETNNYRGIVFRKLCLQSFAAEEFDDGVPSTRIMSKKLINLVADGLGFLDLIFGMDSQKYQGNSGGGKDQSTDLFQIQL